MKIFITGITGLLGRHVAELCANDKHEIVALVRNKKISNSNFPFNVSICYGDVSTIDSLPDNLCNAEIVIHCAADTSMLSIKNSKQDATNITGIINLITASKKANIKRFIHISSANTIAFGSLEKPADESIKVNVKNGLLPYIKTKIIGEEILLHEFKTNNFPVIILNPTFILGPKDYNKSSGKLILAAIKKQVLLYPNGGKNIVDVRDVAQAILNSFYNGKLGNNYLLSNENLTYKEIVTIACETVHVTAPKYTMPTFIGIVIGFIGTCYEIITKKTLSVNNKTIKLSFENHYYTSAKAKNELGFTARSAQETIIDTVNWFTNENASN